MGWKEWYTRHPSQHVAQCQLTRRTIVVAVTMRVHPHHHLQSSMLHCPPPFYLLLCIISISLPQSHPLAHFSLSICLLLPPPFPFPSLPPSVPQPPSSLPLPRKSGTSAPPCCIIIIIMSCCCCCIIIICQNRNGRKWRSQIGSVRKQRRGSKRDRRRIDSRIKKFMCNLWR